MSRVVAEMFKRVIWLGLGAAAGSAGTVWTQRKVKEQIDRARPSAILDRARSGVGELRDTLGAAIEEGRTAMRDSEREMRGDVGRRAAPRTPALRHEADAPSVVRRV